MTDMTPEERLARHRAVRDWLTFKLRKTEDTIRQLEHEVAERRRRWEVARIEMSWKLQPPRADDAEPMLHRGNCSLYKTELGYLDREHVVIAVEQFPGLEMCGVSAPWGSLGIPKPVSRPTS